MTDHPSPGPAGYHLLVSLWGLDPGTVLNRLQKSAAKTLHVSGMQEGLWGSGCLPYKTHLGKTGSHILPLPVSSHRKAMEVFHLPLSH